MPHNQLPFIENPAENALQNRIIFVTGATDGIGRQAALSYARYGASLVLTGRQQSKLDSVARQISDNGGGKVHRFCLDYRHASEADCQQLAEQIAALTPRLDGVLHNAGALGEVCPMIRQTPASWLEVMQVNVNATFFLTRALLPLLLQSADASLVFTSSSVGRRGRANWGAYAVSKFATEGMMQVLAEEYQGSALRVNCINPGGTRSKMRASAFPDEDPGKLKTPADIMPLYIWIMSAASKRYTGQSFDAQPTLTPGIVR